MRILSWILPLPIVCMLYGRSVVVNSGRALGKQILLNCICALTCVAVSVCTCSWHALDRLHCALLRGSARYD